LVEVAWTQLGEVGKCLEDDKKPGLRGRLSVPALMAYSRSNVYSTVFSLLLSFYRLTADMRTYIAFDSRTVEAKPNVWYQYFFPH
jgi:hypothetical protein